MAHRLLLFFCCILIAGCGQKEVLLPVIPLDGIDQTKNHSSIWIFLETSGQDTLAVLNKNNKLLNTNWLFNIDRRLPMKHVIPQLEIMQRDRNKDSMHKKEGMKNYFSYADSKNEGISLVDFPQIEFVRASDVNGQVPIAKDSTCIIDLTILGEKFQLGETSFPVDQVSQINRWLTACDSTQQAYLRLNYSENLKFQEYLAGKAYLASVNLPLDHTEIIHTLK